MTMRSVALVLLAAVVIGCGSAPAGSRGSESPGTPTANPSQRIDSQGLIEVLAASGIAVHETESAAEPIADVAEPQVFAISRWQLENLATEIDAVSGILGSELDAAIAMPDGMPAFSYLLGAWIEKAGTAGSQHVFDRMGTRDWTQAPTVVFPTLALLMFAADVARPGLAEAVARPLNGFASIGSVAQARPCSAVTEFIDRALDSVFNALKVKPGQVPDIPVLPWLVPVWNFAVSIAQGVVQGVITELAQEIVAAVRSAAAVAATVSVALSYLKPWTVRIDPAPSAIHLSVEGGDQVRGAFTMVADNRVDQWPPEVSDCAAAVGVTPPSLSAAGAPVRWAVQFGADVILPDGAAPYATSLDQQKRATLNYSAASEPADWHASGPLVQSTARVTGEVERKEVTELVEMAEQAIFKSLPGPEVVRRIVESALAPHVKALLDGARARLPELLKAHGAATVEVSRHTAPSPTPGATTAASPVWVHFDRPADPGVEPLRLIELYGCDGTVGHWTGTFRVAGLSSLLDVAEIPTAFDIPATGEQTVHVLTETIMVPLPLGDPEPVYADVDIRISADGRTMTFVGRPGIDNIFEPEEGVASMSLPIEPAPPGACD
jgi:hypothetical protein